MDPIPSLELECRGNPFLRTYLDSWGKFKNGDVLPAWKEQHAAWQKIHHRTAPSIANTLENFLHLVLQNQKRDVYSPPR